MDNKTFDQLCRFLKALLGQSCHYSRTLKVSCRATLWLVLPPRAAMLCQSPKVPTHSKMLGDPLLQLISLDVTSAWITDPETDNSGHTCHSWANTLHTTAATWFSKVTAVKQHSPNCEPSYSEYIKTGERSEVPDLPFY